MVEKTFTKTQYKQYKNSNGGIYNYKDVHIDRTKSAETYKYDETTVQHHVYKTEYSTVGHISFPSQQPKKAWQTLCGMGLENFCAFKNPEQSPRCKSQGLHLVEINALLCS